MGVRADGEGDAEFDGPGDDPGRGVDGVDGAPGNAAGVDFHYDAAFGDGAEYGADVAFVPGGAFAEPLIAAVAFFDKVQMAEDAEAADAHQFGDAGVVGFAEVFKGTAVDFPEEPFQIFHGSVDTAVFGVDVQGGGGVHGTDGEVESHVFVFGIGGGLAAGDVVYFESGVDLQFGGVADFLLPEFA